MSEKKPCLLSANGVLLEQFMQVVSPILLYIKEMSVQQK